MNAVGKFIGMVKTGELSKSPHNPRITYDEKRVEALSKHIASMGYDQTRAVKVHKTNNKFFVFAGSTRLAACQKLGLREIPAFLYECTDDELWRMAYEDNESDGKHTTLSIVDVWADYAKRYAEGKTQQAIADALGVARQAVVNRIKWNGLSDKVKKHVSDGLIDEGHLDAISGVVSDVGQLQPWLTTEKAQAELLDEVLAKHVGTSVGIKPTVKKVRDAAQRWKDMITLAQNNLESLEDAYKPLFVDTLVETEARTSAAVSAAMALVLKAKEKAARDAELKAMTEANAAAAKAAKEAAIQSVIKWVHRGDATQFIYQAPKGFKLLLIDPPYGQNFVCGRRVTTPKKEKIAHDDKTALETLAKVLKGAYERMAENGHALIFTGWRNEPQFREVIEQAGFAIKARLIWVKNNHGSGDLKGFAPKHEGIIHAVKGNPELLKRIPDVLTCGDKLQTGEDDHPTIKPIGLLQQLISVTTGPDELVVDCFAGSGSTLFAAHELNRTFWGCELDEGYYNAIVDRLYKKLTEKK